MAMYLPIAVKNISITLEGLLEQIAPDYYELDTFKTVSSLYRQLGIGQFLLSNDADDLFLQLHYSLQAYLEFLQNSGDSQKAISHMAIFFDALIIGDSDAIHKLAQLAPTAMNNRKEYEEDFLFMRILLDVFGLNKTFSEIESKLMAYEAYHNENPDTRFPILKALLEKDNEDFEEALPPYLEEKKQAYADGGDLYRGTLEEAAVNAHVSCEFLGLLKLAELQGLMLDKEYILAPSSARFSYQLPAIAEGSWRQIQSQRSINLSGLRL